MCTESVFDVVEMLVPLMKRLYIDGTNRGAAAPAQICDQGTADETTRTGYDDSAIRRELHSAIIVTLQYYYYNIIMPLTLTNRAVGELTV